MSWPELINVFDTFLPQLLRYPNPSDPLNDAAASLLMKNAEMYRIKVKGARGQQLRMALGVLNEGLRFLLVCFVVIEYVSTYASQSIKMGDEEGDSDVSDMSDIE